MCELPVHVCGALWCRPGTSTTPAQKSRQPRVNSPKRTMIQKHDQRDGRRAEVESLRETKLPPAEALP